MWLTDFIYLWCLKRKDETTRNWEVRIEGKEVNSGKYLSIRAVKHSLNSIGKLLEVENAGTWSLIRLQCDRCVHNRSLYTFHAWISWEASAIAQYESVHAGLLQVLSPFEVSFNSRCAYRPLPKGFIYLISRAFVLLFLYTFTGLVLEFIHAERIAFFKISKLFILFRAHFLVKHKMCLLVIAYPMWRIHYRWLFF